MVTTDGSRLTEWVCPNCHGDDTYGELRLMKECPTCKGRGIVGLDGKPLGTDAPPEED